jgi:hypothetical protein
MLLSNWVQKLKFEMNFRVTHNGLVPIETRPYATLLSEDLLPECPYLAGSLESCISENALNLWAPVRQVSGEHFNESAGS